VTLMVLIMMRKHAKLSSCLHRASVIIKHFIIQLMHNIQYVDTIKIIKYLKVLQHVSDHRRSSSGSLVQCLAKNYKNDAIVSVDIVSTYYILYISWIIKFLM